MKHILITGGAGFIGSHVVRRFVTEYADATIWNLDALTYAGNLENLTDIASNPNYRFVKGDITDVNFLADLFGKQSFDGVIHLAAESHVDRSILSALPFALTNVVGTVNLLDAFRNQWEKEGKPAHKRFYHVSTDEVYGTLGDEGAFTETTPYDPHSPYSASKAASDHFVRAYHDTYGLPIVISNCSNNFGTHHFPEKLIPLCIQNIIHNKPLPIYGKGENVRDWLWVEDHARAIDVIFHRGRNGDTYNIGGSNEWKNIDLVRLLCQIGDEKLGRAAGTSEQLIQFVTDRAGHDFRYAINANKLRSALGWEPTPHFRDVLAQTFQWYIDHQDWVKHIQSGDYQQYYQQQYGNRIDS